MRKIFSKLKRKILSLPGNELLTKYLIWAIILLFVAGILPTFSYDGIQVIKAIYTTNNLPWPPQMNQFNLLILRDVFGMTLLLFVLGALLMPLILFVSSYIIKKILNLWKKDVAFKKLFNIGIYSYLVTYVMEFGGYLLYVPFSHLFQFYRMNFQFNFLLEPFFFIWQIVAYLMIFLNGIVGLIIYIYGIKISLKEYQPKRKLKN